MFAVVFAISLIGALIGIVGSLATGDATLFLGAAMLPFLGFILGFYAESFKDRVAQEIEAVSEEEIEIVIFSSVFGTERVILRGFSIKFAPIFLQVISILDHLIPENMQGPYQLLRQKSFTPKRE